MDDTVYLLYVNRTIASHCICIILKENLDLGKTIYLIFIPDSGFSAISMRQERNKNQTAFCLTWDEQIPDRAYKMSIFDTAAAVHKWLLTKIRNEKQTASR